MSRSKHSKPVAVRRLQIADQIQRDLSELIQQKFKDEIWFKQAGIITVSAVEISADYAHAKIFFTVLNDNEQISQNTAVQLQKKGAILREELGHRLSIHTLPYLHFFYDESTARAFKLDQLINQANSSSHSE